MKDSAGNELHVGDEVRVDDGGPADPATYRNALVTTNSRLLKKVQQTVDPHETVTKIFGKKEGPRP